MNRLQKKCFIATASFHLLLLVILLVGPAFFAPKPKPDETQVLDVIPANIVDAALNSGVRGAQPPPPAPTPAVTQPPQPVPPPPKPVVVPQPEPAPVPKPVVTPAPEPKPAPVEIKPQPPKLDLHLVTRNIPKYTTPPKQQDDPQAKLRADLLKTARALQTKLSSPVVVGPSGDSDAAVANYASVVTSIYYQAWNEEAKTLPEDAANDDADTIVSVTIASDGTVITAHIITPPGDARVAAAVQRMLERVKFIAPFPAGMTGSEWTRKLKFHLKPDQMPE